MIVAGLSGASAQTASTFNAYCHSVALRPAKTSWGTTIVFSTPKGTAYPYFDLVANDIIAGNELRPLPNVAQGYEAGYGVRQSGQFVEYGVAVMEIPATDSDGNGVPDFAQVDRSMGGTFSGTINAYGPSPYTAKLVFTISRAAGATTGTYNAFAVVGGQTIFYDGESVVSSASGTVTYNPSKALIALGGVLSGELGSSLAISAVGNYYIKSGNVVLGSMPIKTPAGNLTALATTLSRVPGTLRFRGSLSLVDGNLSTSWPDYTRWTLEIGDADVNQNGVPDIAEGFVLAPTITSQPTATTVTVGQTATLSVNARGSEPLTYQWRFKGSDIVGATSDTLTINTARLSDDGDYMVVVSNELGSVTSSSVRLIVRPPQQLGLETFVWIAPGGFTMGSPMSDPDRYANEAERAVSISNGFWLCDHEVTQAEYQALMGSNPSLFKGADRPVEMVSWTEAVLYCQKLTERERAAGRITAQQAYRLPTEAEWEYAARAGTTGSRYGSLNDIAWWGENSGGQTHAIRQKTPNAWELYDMIGNVFEWCHDTSGANHEFRSGRGASWYDWSRFTRAAFRGWNTPAYRDSHTGFRVAMGAAHAPEILRQPVPLTLLLGETALLEIEPHGTAPLSFQWMRDGVDVIGATGPRLTITNAQTSESGEYQVRVSNNAGSAGSAPVSVSVRSIVLAAMPPRSVSGEVQPSRVKVRGVSGKVVTLERAPSVKGPWTPWTNMVASPEGSILADLDPENLSRFYRGKVKPPSNGPDGFVWIEPGTFVMGSPPNEPDRYLTEIQHSVTLTQGFWLSENELTQWEYESVIGSNPSFFKGDPNRPVDSIGRDDAVLYCQKLTERERAAGRISAQQAYRLPTEAEWEFAARAGTTGPRYGELNAIAWWGAFFGGNSQETTHPVRQKQPNSLGLYDMIGNVWEWCADQYAPYQTEPAIDPMVPYDHGYGVIRGGSWRFPAGSARSAARGTPTVRLSEMGMRVAFGPIWAKPTIKEEPISLSAVVGQKVEFSVVAQAPQKLYYQWQFQGVDIRDATNTTYLIEAAASPDVGAYRVIVNSDFGATTSAEAHLTLSEKPEGFVWVSPGAFLMGSPLSEGGDWDESQHQVLLTKGFWLCSHEVTQDEYLEIMGSNPSNFRDPKRPVEQVGWEDAVEYCRRLTAIGRLAGVIAPQAGFRLPTEAEWEFAARAGTTGARYGDLDAIAWWRDNSGNQTHAVKQKSPNAWGLYDMIGNVWEWCADFYGEYGSGYLIDPQGPLYAFGGRRVIRGGSAFFDAARCRAAIRIKAAPGERSSSVGFRVAFSENR